MKKLISILSILIITACSNSDNDNTTPQSSFVGNWKGTYIGTGGTSNNGDVGTWDINVVANGNVTGVAHSNTYNENYVVTGSVNTTGQINLTVGTSSAGGNFIGNMNTNGSASGTWSNNIPTPPYSGTWTGTKQ